MTSPAADAPPIWYWPILGHPTPSHYQCYCRLCLWTRISMIMTACYQVFLLGIKVDKKLHQYLLKLDWENMEVVSQSPARQALASLKEKISSEILEKQRQYEALSLSARKINPSKVRTLDSPRTSSRQLFKNSPFREGVQTRLQDNFQSIKDVIEETFQSPRKSSKRKFSCILNENRQNFEAVDLSVDLCFRLSEENELIGNSNKKLRMSV